MDMHSDLLISRSDGRPMYLQIMEQIKQRVAVGDWARGEEIPSIRQLAVALKNQHLLLDRLVGELQQSVFSLRVLPLHHAVDDQE